MSGYWATYSQGKDFPEQNVAFVRHAFPLNKKGKEKQNELMHVLKTEEINSFALGILDFIQQNYPKN